MSTKDQAQGATRQSMKRRDFLKRAGWGSVGVTGLIMGASRSPALAHPPSPYPSWTPPSDKPPKRGGILTRASAWDPPVLDPRLTNSVGLSQIATLIYNRLLRYPFADEAKNNADLTLKGDLAESWEGSADFKIWTFKLRQGVKWHNVPPLNGRELVADDIKYCYEAYAKEGVQSFTFQEIDGMETPDKYTIRIHLKTPNTMFPQNVAEAVTAIFPREVLEEDGDLKSAHDRHRALYPERARAQGQSGAQSVIRTISTKGIRTSMSTVFSRRPMRRRAWRPSGPGRAISWRCKALLM